MSMTVYVNDIVFVTTEHIQCVIDEIKENLETFKTGTRHKL